MSYYIEVPISALEHFVDTLGGHESVIVVQQVDNQDHHIGAIGGAGSDITDVAAWDWNADAPIELTDKLKSRLRNAVSEVGFDGDAEELLS